MSWRQEDGGWVLKVSAIATRPKLERFEIAADAPVFVTLVARIAVAPAEAALEVDADLLITEQGPGYTRTLYTVGDLRNAETARQTAERLVSMEFGKADPLFGAPWPTPGGLRPLPNY